MKSEVLNQFHMPYLTIIALGLFLFTFVGILFWTFRRGSKNIYKSAENLPFKEGELQ